MYTISQTPAAKLADPVADLRALWQELDDAQKLRLARLSQSRGIDLAAVFTRSGDLVDAPDHAAAERVVHLARAANIA